MATEPSSIDPCADHVRLQTETVAVNEALVLGSLRQNELVEAAEQLNAQLQLEVAVRQQTARELAEKARLLDLSNDAIIVRGLDDKITLWNKGAEKLYGWTSEEVIGKDLYSFLQTEFPKPRKEIEARLYQEGLFAGEVVQIARDGRRVASLCRWVLDRDTQSILTSHTDITERRHSEKVLRENEARLRALVTASSDVIYRMNADWSEMGVLDGRNFLKDATQSSRTWFNDNVYAGDQAHVLEVICEAIRTKSIFVLEHRVNRVDGSVGWTISKAVPLFDDEGEIAEWFGTASDVTERRETEAAERATAGFMRSIIASSSDCIKVLDLQGNLLSMEAGQELLGISDLAPLLGKPWIAFWEGEEDRRAAREAVAAAAAGNEGHFVGFFRTLHGEDKWWDVAISPIRSVGGDPERLLAVSRDITKCLSEK